MGIPAIFGAGLLQLREVLDELGTGGLPDLAALLVGLAMAALSGYASIDFLLRYLERHTTAVFVAYRIALGTAILLLTSQGWIR